MDRPQVLVAGLDKPNALGKMVAAALNRLGCGVEYVDLRVPAVPVLGWSIGISDVRQRFVRHVANTDLDVVMVIGGGVLDGGTVERARSRTDAVICNWNPDNPFMARSEERRMESYLEALPSYDVAFIWSEELLDPIRSEGANAVRHLPFARSRRLHMETLPAPEYDSDVVFVGHWSEKRQHVLSALRDLDVDLAIYGNYWKRKCFDLRLRKKVRGPAIMGRRYSQVFCSSDVAINVVADHNLEAYNMKSFEIPATGTFMLTSRTRRQQELYGEGEGIACYGGPDELKEKVKTYLANDEGRERIAKRGEEIARDLTYERRMTEMFADLEEMGLIDAVELDS